MTTLKERNKAFLAAAFHMGCGMWTDYWRRNAAEIEQLLRDNITALEVRDKEEKR